MKKNILLYTNIIICIIITLGFLFTVYISYTSNFKLFEDDINNISKLASENIYSKINSLLEKPIHISLTMANDLFLKEWLENEQTNREDPELLKKLQDYLFAYNNKYNYDSVFLVSEKSKLYYHYKGIDRSVTPDKPENIWYFDFLNKNKDYELFIDVDTANQNIITIFVNCLVLHNVSNKLLGAVGVGLRTDFVQKLLQAYENEFKIKAYLIDNDGVLQVSSEKTRFENMNLFKNKYLEPVKKEILHNKFEKDAFKFGVDGIDIYYIIKYIPNLHWYLVVEKDTTAINQHFKITLYEKIIIISVIIVLVLLITTKVIGKYNEVIMKLINHDILTGIRNRTSYEELLSKYNKNLTPSSHLGLGVLDLNGLKYINDNLGHAAGDIYITKSAELICQVFAHCPVFRVGGDEFVVLFDSLDESQVANLHEAMLESIVAYNTNNTMQLSIAFGYAFYDSAQDTNLEQVFSRADVNMYKNKLQMKTSEKFS